ncbi:MAG: HD domain-containing phosphohydrolase [Desulfuromonadales bacterium]
MFENVKILAVDDDDMNLEMVELMLSEIDCTVIKTLNGSEALEALSANPDVDIILLDLEMPVMDGYETITRLKQSFTWRDIPVIVVTAGTNEVTRTLSLGANDFLPKPYNPEELRLRVMNHVRTKKLADFAKDTNQFLEDEVKRKTSALQDALAFSRETEYEISLRLGRASEFRDQETGMHTRRISELSKQLGKLLGYDEDTCDVLRKSSPLHDVGKIGIPDGILLKPAKLDHDEFEIMKQHTTIGWHILSDSDRYPIMKSGAIIALQHHEKWNGSGYPAGLAGTDIHEFARIVAIVDVFDALTSVRPYKKAFSLEETVSIMKEDSGKHFDPTLLTLFLDNLDGFVAIKEELKDMPEHSG